MAEPEVLADKGKTWGHFDVADGLGFMPVGVQSRGALLCAESGGRGAYCNFWTSVKPMLDQVMLKCVFVRFRQGMGDQSVKEPR